jgi:hypothetical protein
MTTEYFNDLNKKSNGQLKAIIATGKHPYILSARSTTTDQYIIADVETILENRKKKKCYEKPTGILLLGILASLLAWLILRFFGIA